MPQIDSCYLTHPIITMKGIAPNHRSLIRTLSGQIWLVLVIGLAFGVSACAPKTMSPMSPSSSSSSVNMSRMAPSPDPRIGLKPGLFDAEEAIWNMKKLSTTKPAEDFIGVTNSDLAFKGNYVFQGNYNGIMVWDVSNPTRPTLAMEYLCPASQSDVSVYGDLMFVSGEGLSGRLDCGSQGVQEAVSKDRLRGIRIFDISDIKNPKYISNVQTCRGSHTHSVLKDPKDDENVYIYISGSSSVRPEEEVPGCIAAPPSEDPNSALFRIEIIKVPLAHPEQSAIVSAPRIFEGLVAPPVHGASPADAIEMAEAKARGEFVAELFGQERVLSGRLLSMALDPWLKENGKTAETMTKADSAAFRAALPSIIEKAFPPRPERPESDGPRPGPTQCHDITLYPEIGRAGGACGGYGLMLDITDPVNPYRMDAVADSNFSYWHSATFSNDGTKVLFTDEWGGGGQPKCRESDPKEWGANAYFSLAPDGKMKFHSYYKLPAPQTSIENCVAHNGSLIPIPGREVMIQSWYQGGISLFDWTDLDNVFEIGFHDRGPSAADTQGPGGSWSVYWYNGLIVSSEISRGLDIFELTPSGFISANEIEAAKSVKLDYLNAQGQPTYVWPTTFALARSYVDQLERSKGMSASQIDATRRALDSAEKSNGSARRSALTTLAGTLGNASGNAKVATLAKVVKDLAAM
jgi:hypothetical protein